MDESSDDDDDSADGDDHDDKANRRGVDQLPVSQHGLDIPFGLKIPVVSQLAKEASMRDKKTKKQKSKEDVEMDAEETKRRITDFIEKEEDELETHFVENPFIRIREKAARKQLDGRVNLGASDL